MNVGENIKKYRKMKGLTQKELADAIGVSVQAISKWECGATPDISQILPLAEALGASANELLGYNGNREEELQEGWINVLRAHGEGSAEIIEYERKVLLEYPNHQTFGYRLANDLMFHGDACEDKNEAMRYYHQSKLQFEENLKRRPGDENELSQLVSVCMKLGQKEAALQYALTSKRKDMLLKLVYEGEELVHHNQTLMDRYLRSLIMEIRRTQNIECWRIGVNILRAVFADGNYQRYTRHIITLSVRIAGEYVRQGDYDEAMKELWQALALAQQEKSHGDQNAFTSPLFDHLSTEYDYIDGGSEEWRTVIQNRLGYGSYLKAVMTENGLIYPSLHDREDFQQLLAQVDALVNAKKDAT